jgi:SNF2 family DNA or RNA helicase
VLTQSVQEIRSALEKGRVTSATRTKFQAVALMLRDERARVRADDTTGDARRDDRLRRLDDIATSLAKTAVRHPALLALLDEDAVVSNDARELERDLQRRAGVQVHVEEPAPVEEIPEAPAKPAVVPQSVRSRQMANPFLAPDFSAARPSAPRPSPLSSWELLDPLLRSFERAGDGSASMELPEPTSLKAAGGRELMPHQARLVAAAAEGHRTFLLADEPGLGKTAQALLSAEAAKAYPLLVVVPNVVKTNWVREAGLWSPRRSATVIQGNGESVDGFADIVVVNYEVLDRHLGWLREFGFRGMVVDEAHFIKNKTSQRSQHVLALSERIRSFTARPLLMALTGTPLINDIEDFLAIWEFLGWIDEKKPRAELMDALTATGLTPADPGFSAAARRCVIDLGIVRRRKVDVAADIPERRIADLPVELDGPTGRSIRAAERDLAHRMVIRYRDAMAARGSGPVSTPDGIDHDLVRRVATWEQKDANSSPNGDNVFSMMRRIGQAKATLAADYAAQLARSAGKVVFFAKHVDVMDAAEETFAKQGVRYSSIRGDQTPGVRQRNIDAFVEDPEVGVVVCSLTAAGVGINLQVASNVVLAELPWTAAEQTQAIDRSHRIGQSQPVTAWRILAAQTIDARIAALIDDKAGLAAVALDGSDEELGSSTDAQHATLVALLTDALAEELPVG